MKPTQLHVKAGHDRISLGSRSLDIVRLNGRWYVNQFPDTPIDCGSSQSAAAYKAVEILQAEAHRKLAA